MFYSKRPSYYPCLWTLFLLSAIARGGHSDCVQSGSGRKPLLNISRTRNSDRIGFMKDAFYEDYSFVVRVRTSYNHTSSISCNAVLMEPQLVLSDVTCIKYQGMANIDARFVQVIAGEPSNETVHEVEQIYINKADPKDPGTELAILRLVRPLVVDTECKTLIRPERNNSMESDSKVRVVGFTQYSELKESRGKIARRGIGSKYLCTYPESLNGSPGCHLLRGAPLLQMTECNQFQLVGILSRLDIVVSDVAPTSVKRHQDCYVMVSSQVRWFEQVKSLTMLAAKDASSSSQPNVIVVSVDDERTD